MTNQYSDDQQELNRTKWNGDKKVIKEALVLSGSDLNTKRLFYPKTCIILSARWVDKSW